MIEMPKTIIFVVVCPGDILPVEKTPKNKNKFL